MILPHGSHIVIRLGFFSTVMTRPKINLPHIFLLPSPFGGTQTWKANNNKKYHRTWGHWKLSGLAYWMVAECLLIFEKLMDHGFVWFRFFSPYRFFSFSISLKEPGASNPAVCECRRQHQGQSEADRPSTIQRLLAALPGQSQSPRREGEDCVRY